MEDQVYSVSQLNREAKRLLAQHFLSVSVTGEISNLSMPASGHIYFTLKDAQAQVRCAMFRGQLQRCKIKPSNGIQVLARVEVSLYEPRGDYQLVVEQLAAAGDGALRLAFERLKDKLQAEGLFDLSRKAELPQIPKCIGVITSPSGAAIHDILTVLKRRFPAIPVIIYPVAVQGETAKFEIAAALNLANQRAETDVILLARGGGSLEDLWAFNEEIVARAIADSKIPVISGVGHEVDITISDFVADIRAATPSAAAEHAVPLQADWFYTFDQYERTLRQNWQRLVEKKRQQQHPGQQYQRNAQRLDEMEQRLRQGIQHRLSHQLQHWTLINYRLQQAQPTARIQLHQQQLQYWEKSIISLMQSKIAGLKQKQAATAQTLHAISPLATLERGYSINHEAVNGQIIKSSQQLQPGDKMLTRLADGQILSQVEEIIYDQNSNSSPSA